MVCLSLSEVGGALESIRALAVKRGKGNMMYRETSVATLELLMPRESKKVIIDITLDCISKDRYYHYSGFYDCCGDFCSC